ncbi:MAG TPA: type IV pilin protein [Paucimonas sp.]|nr:type IV pilin protein [Paucimonas sp.]
MNTSRPCGFTLIELGIVLVIVAILATLAYPSYLEFARKARRAEARAALFQLMQQEERFYSQNTRYVAFSADSSDADARKFKWYSSDSPSSSAYEITASACRDDTLQQCVMLTARPGTARVNAAYRDPVCGDLILTSAGVKAASGGGKNCWQ